MTTYYVSSIVGSDNNAGTSSSAPLNTLQAAEALVKPGDTVQVMNGTYTTGGGGNVLTISTSGTASAPITFEAAPGATPVINSSGAWQGIEIDASYITINGFTVVGDAANYNLTSAMAGYSTGNANLDGNGIAATSGNQIHNIIIENNTVYNEPGAGIAMENGDYIQILNNNVHDNAHWSAYGQSGITVGASYNYNNAAGPHIIISGNTLKNNSELVPEYRAGAITDGEGIILDSNNGYTGGFLVENNTITGSGGPGIKSFFSDNAVITGNTATGDLTVASLASEGEIFINQSNNNTVSNNITTTGGAQGTAPTVAITSAGGTVNSAVQTVTGTVDVADAGSEVTVLEGTTPIGTGTAGANGVWSASVTLANQGANVLTATDTNAAGTGTSGAVTYTLSPSAALTNGSFETGSFSGWTVGGNSGILYGAQQLFVDTVAESGTYAAAMGSMGADGTLSQTVATTAGQTYTLSFWLRNDGAGTNDFNATWNGQTLVSLTNAAQFGYKQYSYTVTATSAASTLEFSAANVSSQWDLDNISLTANGTSSPVPTVTAVTDSPATGDLNAGKTVALKLSFSGNVTVAGGTPTLTLNDGGSATYASGSGSNTLTFNTTVAAGQNAASLAATAVNLPSGVTIKDGAGNAANLSLTSLTQSGPQVDTSAPAAPKISSDSVSGNIVTLNGTAEANSTITAYDNSTKLGTAAANSSGAWTFTTGTLASGSQSFTATATDGAGNVSPSSSALAVSVTNPTVTTIAGITDSPATGDLNAGKTVALKLSFSGNVTVAGGTPTLTLNDGGTATYASGSGSNTLTFNTTVAAGQNAASLAATAVNLPSGVTIKDGAGNAANLSLTSLTQSGPQVDTSAPAAPKISSNSVSGNIVTLKGTAEANSTITAYDNSTKLGTAAANSSGAWTFTTGTLASGSQSFTATATDGAGNVSPSSSALVVTLAASQGSGGSTANLVTNGSFETDSFSGWTLGGNSAVP